MPQANPTRSPDDLTLGVKLKLIREHTEHSNRNSICSEFGLDQSSVQQVLDTHMIFEKTTSLLSRHKNLTIGDKIRVLHYLETIPNLTTVGGLFSVTHFAIVRIRDQNLRILEKIFAGFHTL